MGGGCSTSKVQDETVQNITHVTLFDHSNDGPSYYRIPALVFLDNHFLAFCEERLERVQDYGAMNMVLKRGKLVGEKVNWCKNKKILYTEGNRTGTDRRRPMNPVPIVLDEKNLILLFNTYPENMKKKEMTIDKPREWQLVMMSSSNGGETWKHEELKGVKNSKELKDFYELFSDITGADSGVPNYCAIGPGHGIKLKSGRLIVSGHVKCPKKCGEKDNTTLPFVIVSDNNGKTWKMGGLITDTPVDGNECQPVDAGSNNIVINCRTPGTDSRLQCYSADGGNTFSHSEKITALIGPNGGCQGSTLGFKAPRSNDDDPFWAILSNPVPDIKDTTVTERKNLSIRLSKNGCETWSEDTIHVIEEKNSAYSDLTSFTQDDQLKFACLYEHDYNIDFVIFDISDQFRPLPTMSPWGHP